MSRKQKITVSLTIAALVAGIAFFWIDWSSTRQDLDLTRTELAGTQATLESKENELSATKDELLVTKNQLQSTKDYLLNAEAELQTTKDHLLNVEAELLATKTRLSAIQTDALHLHNPAFEEVTDFLREDKTDSNKYVEDEYICSHFARDVNNNAESQGIRCAYIDLRFPQLGHAIVAFDTVDEGIVYFDAVTDERVKPVIGKEYWQCIEPRPGYYYTKPPYDDTIEDIIIIW